MSVDSLFYSSITIRGGGCPKCGSKRYWPSNEVIKGCAGMAKCQSCGNEAIVLSEFFSVLNKTLGPVRARGQA